MLSCGEASGDLYAGALVAALRAREPGLDAFGLGGSRLAASGARLVADYHGLAVTGLVEALSVLPRSWATYRQLVDEARSHRPDVLVLVDFPDFNFRLMKAVKALGVPIVYYISPQLWAWRPGRMKTIQALVDRVLVIFPFEREIYERAGVEVLFVGHPLLELSHASADRASLAQAFGLDLDRPVVALLPGSRPNELHRLASVLSDAAVLLAARVRGAQFVVARAPNLADDLFAPFKDASGPTDVRVVAERTDDVLSVADVVLTASGTATVQTAIHGKPMAVLSCRRSPIDWGSPSPGWTCMRW
jgi:lipid-A-disaccharide synthase